MNLTMIKLWLAYSLVIFTCISFFIPHTSLAQGRHNFKRPYKGKFDYSITPVVGVEYVYMNDKLLSHSTYSTINLFYKLRTSFIAHRYDLSLDFRYALQSYSLDGGFDLQGVLEGNSYELDLSYRHYFPGSSNYTYLGGEILMHLSTRETNVYDTRLFLNETFISGLITAGYVKKFNALAFSISINLPVISYLFGTRYDITHPVFSDERLTASQAVPRNVLERENEFAYLLSSHGSWRLPHQFFYAALKGGVIYPIRKNMRLSFNYELRYVHFENTRLFRSYSRFLSFEFSYHFL